MNRNSIKYLACSLALALVCVKDIWAASPSNETASEAITKVETPDALTPAEKSSELSVMPLDQREFPEDRPDWITSRATEHGVDYPDENSIIIVTPLLDSPDACLDYLAVTTKAAIQEFVARATDSLSDGDFYTISDEDIENLVTESYQGTVQQGGMTMHEGAVRLLIPAKTKREIEAAWNNAQVDSRLRKMLGVVFAGVILLIGSSAVVGTISRRVERRDRLSQPTT